MADLLGVSVTGLRVAQTALSTTGHNIANAGTEGYSRQRIDAVTNPAIFKGAGYIGNGANVNSIERIANDFITQQLRIDSTLNSDLKTYYEQVSQLDNLLSNDATGLTSAMQSFFAAMQNGTDDPTSIPARQLIVSEAEGLADRFNSIDGRMRVIEKGVKDGLEVAVSQANALVSSIAELNQRISNSNGLSSNAQPNDLLDQRDEALRQLSELLPIQTFEQGRGEVNVIVAGGQSLIVGGDVKTLRLGPSESSAAIDAIYLNTGDSQADITRSISGGELGALLRFRDESLFPSYNSLGRIALAVGQEFNDIHQKGITLENVYGGNFFNDINAGIAVNNRIISSTENAPPADREMSLQIHDVSQLTTSDYQVEMVRDGLYRVERLSDGEEVATGLFPGNFPFSVEFDGMELEFGGGSFTQGDSFLLQPTKNAAMDFKRLVANPEDIAFASPLLTDADIGNTGTGIISAGEVLSLEAPDGTPLPLLATPGEMAPPLMIQFTSPTTYDVLDATDPANPAQLEPPLRNQRYIPGSNNPIFPTVAGQTQVTTSGEMMGLPEGRKAVTQAAVIPNAINPFNATTGLSTLEFGTLDFSGAQQFSFDIVVSETVSGALDSTTTVTVNHPNIADEATLLEHVNAQLAGSNAEAYISISASGHRSIAFSLAAPGYGNVSIANYAGPGSGSSNALLNIDIEAGGTFTSAGGANGVEGLGVVNNNYPSEQITITAPAEKAGLAPTVNTVFSQMNASARVLAGQISNVPGVSANASSYAEVTSANFSNTAPSQLSLNGYDLIEYSLGGTGSDPDVLQSIPDPQTDPSAFNRYLADRINSHSGFSEQGIYAVSGQDAVTGEFELRVYSSAGDDLNFSFESIAGNSIDISDGNSSPLTLEGGGNNIRQQIVVGGKLDIQLDEGLVLSTRPPQSLLFGNTQAADFAQSTYLGIAASITGTPETGDRFTLDFNRDAQSDNRNGLSMINIEQAQIMNGDTARISDAYGTLVEKAGIDTNTAKINADASKAVLDQTQSLRDSLSGVNLDEEAANLIKYEQFFQANAQVISVARNLFDTLIGAF